MGGEEGRKGKGTCVKVSFVNVFGDTIRAREKFLDFVLKIKRVFQLILHFVDIVDVEGFHLLLFQKCESKEKRQEESEKARKRESEKRRKGLPA